MNVGDVVTIRVRDPRNAAIFASGVVREFNEYSGKILPNPKWVAQDAITLSTGISEFPFRIIDRERIIELGEPVAIATRSETFIVQGSKPGSTYTVTRDGSHWSCTCVGFGFRKDCKHVRECKA
jgi:hypothetical protein